MPADQQSDPAHAQIQPAATPDKGKLLDSLWNEIYETERNLQSIRPVSIDELQERLINFGQNLRKEPLFLVILKNLDMIIHDDSSAMALRRFSEMKRAELAEFFDLRYQIVWAQTRAGDASRILPISLCEILNESPHDQMDPDIEPLVETLNVLTSGDDRSIKELMAEKMARVPADQNGSWTDLGRRVVKVVSQGAKATDLPEKLQAADILLAADDRLVQDFDFAVRIVSDLIELRIFDPTPTDDRFNSMKSKFAKLLKLGIETKLLNRPLLSFQTELASFESQWNGGTVSVEFMPKRLAIEDSLLQLQLYVFDKKIRESQTHPEQSRL